MTLLAGVETGHVVHFYDHEETLALAVADFLGAGLVRGGPALVVATPAHQDAIACVLQAAGIDLEAARAEQRYIELDAEELLSRFTVNGDVDVAGFNATVPAVVSGLAGRGEPVRVYGEMVDLLWRRGNVQAAHDLEMLWNSIGAGRDFALLCGYGSTVVDSVLSDGRAEVVGHHHAVVTNNSDPGPGDASRRFEPTLLSAAAARRFTRETLNAWGMAAVLPEAELVISELATNAAVHTAKRFAIGLTRLGDGRVRAAVADGSKSRPSMRDGAPSATHGRGLRIVSALAEDWGVDDEPFGKTVWVVLAPRPEQH